MPEAQYQYLLWLFIILGGSDQACYTIKHRKYSSLILTSKLIKIGNFQSTSVSVVKLQGKKLAPFSNQFGVESQSIGIYLYQKYGEKNLNSYIHSKKKLIVEKIFSDIATW